MDFGLHHITKRIRVYSKLELYPSNNFWIRFLDRLLIIIAILGPLMAFPQLYAVYSSQNADNISFFSWGSWAFMNLIWLVYGLVHKQKPIIITYILWFLVNTSMAIAPIIF